MNCPKGAREAGLGRVGPYGVDITVFLMKGTFFTAPLCSIAFYPTGRKVTYTTTSMAGMTKFFASVMS